MGVILVSAQSGPGSGDSTPRPHCGHSHSHSPPSSPSRRTPCGVSARRPRRHVSATAPTSLHETQLSRRRRRARAVCRWPGQQTASPFLSQWSLESADLRAGFAREPEQLWTKSLTGKRPMHGSQSASSLWVRVPSLWPRTREMSAREAEALAKLRSTSQRTGLRPPRPRLLRCLCRWACQRHGKEEGKGARSLKNPTDQSRYGMAR